jgi:hypothetical protein
MFLTTLSNPSNRRSTNSWLKTTSSCIHTLNTRPRHLMRRAPYDSSWLAGHSSTRLTISCMQEVEFIKLSSKGRWEKAWIRQLFIIV